MLSFLIMSMAFIIRSSKASCTPGYTAYNGSCFRCYTRHENYTSAEAQCVNDGGHLTSIHSAEEQQFVGGLIAAAGISGVDGIWIGMTVSDSPTWTWIDKSPLGFTNWEPVIPDQAERFFMGLEDPFTWFRQMMTSKSGFLCRIDPAKKREAFFRRIAGPHPGLPTEDSPRLTVSVKSHVECAIRCVDDDGCNFFTVFTQAEGYMCTTYRTMTDIGSKALFIYEKE